MMRIIAGEKRGTKLLAPEGLDTRPTTDRVKESLFACIQFDVPGARVLDLFAGSGALGLEALSRGAREACFCDNNAKSVDAIEKNIARVGYEDRCRVIKNDYRNATKLFQNTEKFDIVFIDPPYQSGYYLPVLTALAGQEVLADDAVIVAESDMPVVLEAEGYRLHKQKKYGKTYLTFYRWEGR